MMMIHTILVSTSHNILRLHSKHYST